MKAHSENFSLQFEPAEPLFMETQDATHSGSMERLAFYENGGDQHTGNCTSTVCSKKNDNSFGSGVDAENMFQNIFFPRKPLRKPLRCLPHFQAL
jgi:hypothetical protein